MPHTNLCSGKGPSRKPFRHQYCRAAWWHLLEQFSSECCHHPNRQQKTYRNRQMSYLSSYSQIMKLDFSTAELPFHGSGVHVWWLTHAIMWAWWASCSFTEDIKMNHCRSIPDRTLPPLSSKFMTHSSKPSSACVYPLSTHALQTSRGIWVVHRYVVHSIIKKSSQTPSSCQQKVIHFSLHSSQVQLNVFMAAYVKPLVQNPASGIESWNLQKLLFNQTVSSTRSHDPLLQLEQ